MGKGPCKATGKVRHATKEAACIVAGKTKRKPILNAYRCASCGDWHLGRSRSPIRAADWIGTLLARHERSLRT